jgi:hypothetical protein
MTDDLPAWASNLKVRQLLWQNYGVPFEGIELSDFYGIVLLAGADVEREKNRG